MPSPVNRRFRLAARPNGRVGPDTFRYSEEPLPKALGPGRLLVRNLYLSLDPSNRLWLDEVEHYVPPVQVGEIMRGLGLGQVLQSNHPGFAPGDLVYGVIGWQDYLVTDGQGSLPLARLPRQPALPLPAWLAVLGLTGMSAYVGLLDIGQLRPGETVVISAAAGAVGSLVGQIARIQGARAVGIAGSAEKCAWLVGELGFDAAVSYRAPDWQRHLAAACPQGVDLYFESVGGPLLDAVLPLMKRRGRVVVCGLLSTYNSPQPQPGPSHFSLVLLRRLRVEGFVILDHTDRFSEATARLGEWLAQGRLKYRATVVEGLERAPEAFNWLFDGRNVGKLMVKIADPLPDWDEPGKT